MTWRKINSELPTIVKVGALDDDCFDITLSNGHTILLELGNRINEPIFAKLIERKQFYHPKTDGKQLYWIDGPSFTVAEILAMLARDKEQKAVRNWQEKYKGDS